MGNDMSNTPRTDAVEWTAGHGTDDRTVVFADFARELERENARLREAAETAMKYLDDDNSMGGASVYIALRDAITPPPAANSVDKHIRE